jgi:hypothetical protein
MENQLVEIESKALVFGTNDAEGVLWKATAIANLLAPIVEKAKLYSMISGRKYVKVEGWATMLSMLGIFPSTEYARRLDREGEICYEARVVLRHTSGLEVGAGEGICSSKEKNWANRDEFAIKSMAQTRATGKAARLGFSWIVALAGYEGTPLEEMPTEDKVVHEAHEAEVVEAQEVTFIPYAVNVKTGSGKKGEWSLFFIKDSGGVTYTTFDKAHAELAKTAKEARLEVVVRFHTDSYGNKIDFIKMHGSQNA